MDAKQEKVLQDTLKQMDDAAAIGFQACADQAEALRAALAVVEQSRVMIRARGRYNTEQATIKLAGLLGIELKAYEPEPAADDVAARLRNCLVCWRCVSCRHDLIEMPEDPFGACPECGLKSVMHQVFSIDMEGLIEIAKSAGQAQPVAVPDGYIQVKAEELQRIATHAKIAADNIVEYSKAGHTMYGWLDDACTHADIAAKNASAMLAAAPSPAAEGAKVADLLSAANPPFDNCRYRICDLPGQCRGEGKCHHPAIERAVLAQPSGAGELADFEAWATAHNLISVSHGIRSEHSLIELMRSAWQAGRSALAQQQGLDAEPLRQLERCVSYLADLNGCEWIKGDDHGSVDMRQRAKALQSTAFAALAQTRGQEAELWQAIRDMLSQRIGELPTQGWLRDNDKTRQAVARIAAIAEQKGQQS